MKKIYYTNKNELKQSIRLLRRLTVRNRDKGEESMAALDDLRIRLDEIDGQIVRLYEERMKVCEEVGELKVKSWGRVLDRQRERNKLNDVASRVSNDFNRKGIQELYEQLMSMSRKLQYQQIGFSTVSSMKNCSKALL